MTNFGVPEPGAVYSVNTFTVNRRNRGGERQQVREEWVVKEFWNLTFGKKSTTEIDTLVAFIIANAGKCVQFVNEYGEKWNGYIISTEIPIRQITRNTAPAGCPDNRLWTIQFEFEGVPV